MAEDIKGLIEKIQQDGINVAQAKAKEIESAARKNAEEVLAKARNEAEKIINDAKDKARETQESTTVLLKQAGRDLILGLRKEINILLNKIAVLVVRHALAPEELVKIISGLIKEHHLKEGENVVVSLRKEDLEKIEKWLFAELSEKIKKGITLKSSEDITGGFIISFDSQKSHYDFSDKALADYISVHLKPKLSQILKTG